MYNYLIIYNKNDNLLFKYLFIHFIMYNNIYINDVFDYFLEVLITLFIITLKSDLDFNYRKSIKRVFMIIFKKEINKYLFLIVSLEYQKYQSSIK